MGQLLHSLYERMQEIPDPRCERKKAHDCAEMLTYLTMGYMAGRLSLRRALAWASSNKKLLQKHMKLRGGIASVSTVSRLLNGIDEEIFALTFSDWVTQLLKRQGIHIIIDGKALVASTRKREDGNIPYVLNAIDAATELVIAQMPIDSKTNEITAIPELLDVLDIKGNTVTIDAIGTQTAIMEKLNRRGAGFVLQVKKNQPQILEDISSFFDTLTEENERKKAHPGYKSAYEEQLAVFDTYTTNEKNRERYEYREYVGCRDTSCISKIDELPYLKTVGMSLQVRRVIKRDSDGNDITPSLESLLSLESNDEMNAVVQKVGIVSNMELSAKEIGQFKRDHWKIENGLHHILDDTFREDRSPAKGSRNNLALIRKIAYNLVRYALITSSSGKTVIEMLDHFADNPKQMMTLFFEPLSSLS